MPSWTLYRNLKTSRMLEIWTYRRLAVTTVPRSFTSSTWLNAETPSPTRLITPEKCPMLIEIGDILFDACKPPDFPIDHVFLITSYYKDNLILHAALSLNGRLLTRSKCELITNANESNERFKAL